MDLASTTCELELSLVNQTAVITLNRAEKANALSEPLWHEFPRLLRACGASPEVRSVVIAAAGEVFCGGIDLSFLAALKKKAFALPEREDREAFLRAEITSLQSSFTALTQCPKPVIAAIRGPCIGAGMGLITACDLRYAARTALFSIKEVDLGIAADVGSLQRLLPQIPFGVVAEWAFTGRNISAQDAKAWGLLNEVQEDPLAHALEVASSLNRKDPQVLAAIKQSLYFSLDHPIQASLAEIAQKNAIAFSHLS